MKSAWTTCGAIEAAGFSLRKGSITSLYPSVSSSDAACPYQVNFVVTRTSFLYSIGEIKAKSIPLVIALVKPNGILPKYYITILFVGNSDKKTYNQTIL